MVLPSLVEDAAKLSNVGVRRERLKLIIIFFVLHSVNSELTKRPDSKKFLLF